jgi:XTP/dITP diphosphohydrolase
MRLVLATRNDHKVRELSRLMPGVALEALPGAITLPPEDGDTFAANALGKARAAAAALGRPAVADDSGIEAAALGGAPGIFSARYAGPSATDGENLAKLRAEAPAGSPLRYVCVMAYATPQGEEITFTGTCEGTLAAAARGSGGFGYDPAFLPDDRSDGRTMAELSDEEKDAISHRGRAARALLAWLLDRNEAAAAGGDVAAGGDGAAHGGAAAARGGAAAGASEGDG